MMLYLKKRTSQSGLSVSLFYQTAVLILLTRCCAGQFQVVGPVQPVIVTIGEDIVLPCHLKPTVDAVGMTIEWARLDLSPRFVHVWHQRKDLHVNQHPSYKGRTSMSINRLQHGDISLILTKVKISDNGIYRCYLPDLEKYSTVQLVVGIASSLEINLAGIDRSSLGVVLQCEAKGWYPEPEVFWLDGEGKLLSAGPTETVRGPDDLYTVSRRLTVEKSDNFTCRVQQKNIKQTRETHFYVPDDFFVAPCSSAPCISVSLVACFICVLSVVFAVWKWRQNKIKTKEALEGEKERLVEENTKMRDIVAKLEEKQKDFVITLTKQKDKLNKQKNKVKERVEKNNEKLQSVEKDIREKDENKLLYKAPGYLSLKEITSQYKTDLNGTLQVLEKLLMNTEELLVTTQNTEEAEKTQNAEEKKEAENHMDEEARAMLRRT